MKFKFNPVQYIFIFYIAISSYLIFSYFSFQQYFKAVQVLNLSPIAYGLLIISSIVLALSLFSLFRIPIFHYLFKMVNLWIIILFGSILYLFFTYRHILTDVINPNAPHKIAEFFPGIQPDTFKPVIDTIQNGLNTLDNRVIMLLLIITVILAIIQIILYLPTSLRYVYFTHVSPFKYTLKHVLVSVLLFAILIFTGNYLFKMDTSLNLNLKNLLSQKQQSVPDSENLFYPMLTMWMPDIPNRIGYGKSWLSGFKNMLANNKNNNMPTNPATLPDYQKLVLGGMNKQDQAAINQLYIMRLVNDDNKVDKEITKYIEKYRAPLQTVHSIYNYKRYQNPITYTVLSYTNYYRNYYGSFLSLQRLNLLQDLINHSTDIELMVKNIRDNYYFNLKVIRHSNDPKVKLLHLEKQAIITQFLYNLLNKPKFQNKNIYHLIDHLPFLAKNGMSQALIAKKVLQLVNTELVQANKNLLRARSNTANFIKYTYKYGKTLNCVFDRATDKYNLGNQNISAYINRPNTSSAKASLDNMIGNAICKTSIADTDDNIFIKSVEINGRIMILKSRKSILENNIKIFNVDSYLNNHSEKFHNPFSGMPLKWDRDTHQIYFEYNNGGEKVKVSY